MKPKNTYLIKYNTPLFLLILSSCEKKPLDPASAMNVSQGTYIGVIHVSWDPVPGAQYYNIERQGSDGQWKAVSGDYTDNISPADIESNNGIYYVYGDGTDLTPNYYPTTLKAKFLTK